MSRNVRRNSRNAIAAAERIPNPRIGRSIVGSGTALSVQSAHPNHQTPTDAIAPRVTRSAMSEPEVSCTAIRWTSKSSPPPM